MPVQATPAVTVVSASSPWVPALSLLVQVPLQRALVAALLSLADRLTSPVQRWPLAEMPIPQLIHLDLLDLPQLCGWRCTAPTSLVLVVLLGRPLLLLRLLKLLRTAPFGDDGLSAAVPDSLFAQGAVPFAQSCLSIVK